MKPFQDWRGRASGGLNALGFLGAWEFSRYYLAVPKVFFGSTTWDLKRWGIIFAHFGIIFRLALEAGSFFTPFWEYNIING